MIKVAIPHSVYSANKVGIKNIIKKYGMSWDGSRNGWINVATGDAVYIDRAVMDMILSDSFAGDMPMTMYVDSHNQDFLAELEGKVRSIGGEIGAADTAPGGMPAVPAVPAEPAPAARHGRRSGPRSGASVRLGNRDEEGCTAPELADRAAADLEDISRRWERRKRQIMREYRQIGLDQATIDKFLQREEIAFRKGNACWVTGEFPADGSGGDAGRDN